MRTILLFNDNTAEARHAAVFVLGVAQKVQANVLLANTYVKHVKPVKLVPAGFGVAHDTEETEVPNIKMFLENLIDTEQAFQPKIAEADISNMNEAAVADLLNRNNVWMMIKGVADGLNTGIKAEKLNIHTILNKVLCPLMLIPASWQIKDLERLVYLADLRYCRIQIVRYLAEMAKPWGASVLIAHLSASGLPDMAESYARSVFNDGVCQNVKYNNLYYNNIKERNLKTAVDVIINGMHNDLLVLVNHRFHFEEIIGPYITNKLPLNITVPILVFPF
jgi:hypothetical protein